MVDSGHLEVCGSAGSVRAHLFASLPYWTRSVLRDEVEYIWYNSGMLSEKIRKELTDAMRAKDSLKMNTLRGLLSAFTNELVAKGIKPQEQISDEDALAVIKRAVKQRKDSIEQFRNGKREDLAQKEEAELKILETYMPAQMSREQIEVVAKQVKEKLGITDKSKMGQFVGAVIKETKSQADGSVVKEIVESLLQ